MWLYLILGLVVGAGLVALVQWLRSRDIKVSWWEWLIGIIGLLLLMFAIQNSYASIEEVRTNTIGWWILIAGLPAAILIAIPVISIQRRYRKS